MKIFYFFWLAEQRYREANYVRGGVLFGSKRSAHSRNFERHAIGEHQRRNIQKNFIFECDSHSMAILVEQRQFRHEQHHQRKPFQFASVQTAWCYHSNRIIYRKYVFNWIGIGDGGTTIEINSVKQNRRRNRRRNGWRNRRRSQTASGSMYWWIWFSPLNHLEQLFVFGFSVHSPSKKNEEYVAAYMQKLFDENYVFSVLLTSLLFKEKKRRNEKVEILIEIN